MATISDILMEQGRHAAESKRARAGAWTPFLQYAAQLPGQIMADRQGERDRTQATADAAQQREARGVQIARGQQELAAGERAETTALATAEQQTQMRDVLATPGVIGDDGRFDIAAAQRAASEKGYRTVLPDVLTFGREWNEGVDKGLLTKEQIASARRANQPKEPEPFTLSPGQQRFDSAGQPLASVAAEEKPDTRALNIQLADAIKRGDKAAMTAIRQAMRQGAEATRDPNAGPRDPLETTTTWAVDPSDGVAKPMTLAEARRIGAAQPPTADMRNKEAGKRTAARAVTAVRDLGAGIITKVGPAQRMDAIKRGGEAVFGNDPAFRTYQDSRMALAGTLAVEQQGSRVSDADVKALWLPMVPDAFRDTAESYKLKWDLIDAMRGVAPAAGNDDAYAEYLKRQGAPSAR